LISKIGNVECILFVRVESLIYTNLTNWLRLKFKALSTCTPHSTLVLDVGADWMKKWEKIAQCFSMWFIYWHDEMIFFMGIAILTEDMPSTEIYIDWTFNKLKYSGKLINPQLQEQKKTSSLDFFNWAIPCQVDNRIFLNITSEMDVMSCYFEVIL
jgi:hypothetical protein